MTWGGCRAFLAFLWAMVGTGENLTCGCALETAAHGRIYAVRAANDVAKKFDLVAPGLAETCEPTPEIAP